MNDLNWAALRPEIILLGMTCFIALADLFVTDERRRPTFWLTVIALVVFGGLHLEAFGTSAATYGMQRMVVSDWMGHLLSAFAALSVLVTLVYGQVYAAGRDLLKGELFTLSLFVLLGAAIMIAGNNFLVIYLGLELMSLSLYALVALRRDHAISTEAAMKYFVLGALASGFLLYGLSMIYGASGGELDIPRVFSELASGHANKQVLAFGLVFIVAGLAFKLGVVPFHMWVPDVYHGAPTVTTLLIASAPKIAAFAMLERILVEGLLAPAEDWQQMLMILSVCSLVVGNLAAIAQTNLKRMLAYSTIAQMGFMLLGFTPTVISGNTISAASGYAAAMFYVLTYVITTLGTFGLIMLLSR
ncbi:MAG: NADH-quinone oxidoreductase subunit N, partial [Aquabacterium sp.]